MTAISASSLERPARSPEHACRSFTRALGAGQLEVATACFTRDGCLVTPDATAVRGRESIRDVLAQLIARHTQVAVESSTVLATADVALAHERWTIRSDGAEGASFVQRSAPTLVLRRVEGDWKLAIAAPWSEGERALPSRRSPIETPIGGKA
jgi:uncharacterized protein (TIGR02246 family)